MQKYYLNVDDKIQERDIYTKYTRNSEDIKHLRNLNQTKYLQLCIKQCMLFAVNNRNINNQREVIPKLYQLRNN